MRSIKPGRGPSAKNAVGGIISIVFGIFAIILMTYIASAMPQPFRTLVPLIAVIAVLSGVVNLAFDLYNTASKNRLSTFDITSSDEEPDPLNEILGPESENANSPRSIESKLQALEDLRARRVISDAEYTSQRQRILNSI